MSGDDHGHTGERIHAPGCDWGDISHFHDHPCGRKPEPPGAPCRWCEAAVPMSADPCPSCWTPIPTNHADAKALLAIGGFSLLRDQATS